MQQKINTHKNPNFFFQATPKEIEPQYALTHARERVRVQHRRHRCALFGHSPKR
jgi:hypothetical protein